MDDPLMAALKLTRLSDVEPQTVDWFWHPYIPKGKLTVLEGDPGVGKSWVSLSLATAASLGRGLPGQTAPVEPANVIVMTAEDGLADTVRPRLDAMGADVSRVLAFEGPAVFDLATIAVIESRLAAFRPALIIIDPLVAYLGERVDLHRSNETRPILAALAALAERHSIAILLIRHITKSARERAIYRGLGGIDITAAARSVLLAGYDTEDNTKCGIVHIKSNLAARGPAIGYCLNEGVFRWTGDSDLTAERILAPENGEATRAAKEEACDFLRGILIEPVPAKEVQAAAREAGISVRTLARAKGALRVYSQRVGGVGENGGWVWALPKDGQNPPNSAKDANSANMETLAHLAPDKAETGIFPHGDGILSGDSDDGHDARAAVLLLAEQLGFPAGIAVSDGGAGTVAEGKESWCQFCEVATAKRLEMALAVLRALQSRTDGQG